MRAKRAVGMHAQIMPTLISTMDQFETDQLSHVGLRELANDRSDWRRSMLTMVTLEMRCISGWTLVGRGDDAVVMCSRAQGEERGKTYKIPTQNIKPTPNFFFQCRRSFGSWLSGIASIHMSSTMLMIALLQPIALTFKHEPLTSPCQFSQ